MTTNLKFNLLQIFVRSTLLYGTESSNLTYKDRLDMAVAENKMIRRSLNLDKNSSVSSIMRGFKYELLEESIKARQINFTISLAKNKIGSEILSSQIDKPGDTFNKSLYNKILMLNGVVMHNNIGEMINLLEKQIKDRDTLKQINKKLISEEDEILVYLANNNSQLNQDFLVYLTSWEFNKGRGLKRQMEQDLARRSKLCD